MVTLRTLKIASTFRGLQQSMTEKLLGSSLLQLHTLKSFDLNIILDFSNILVTGHSQDIWSECDGLQANVAWVKNTCLNKEMCQSRKYSGKSWTFRTSWQ